MNCGEGPVLTHHARNLSRKVAAGCREHLPNVGRPRGSLVLSAAGGVKGLLSAGSLCFPVDFLSQHSVHGHEVAHPKEHMSHPQACSKIAQLRKLYNFLSCALKIVILITIYYNL